MEITYGLDPDHDGKVTEFVPASRVSDWSWVSGVRIGFLLTAVGERSDDILHQPWVTYIDIRSRDIV